VVRCRVGQGSSVGRTQSVKFRRVSLYELRMGFMERFSETRQFRSMLFRRGSLGSIHACEGTTWTHLGLIDSGVVLLHMFLFEHFDALLQSLNLLLVSPQSS